MKYLLLFSTFIFATSLYGLSARSSWKEIRNDNRADIKEPKLPGGIFNLCHEDGRFKTIKKVRVCERYEETEITNEREEVPHRYCADWSRRHMSYPRETTKNKCVDWVDATIEENGYCARYVTVSHMRPLRYKIEVWVERTPRAGFLPEFTKRYKIPACD